MRSVRYHWVIENGLHWTGHLMLRLMKTTAVSALALVKLILLPYVS
jgi:predicted transposase YbfD/YdcC